MTEIYKYAYPCVDYKMAFTSVSIFIYCNLDYCSKRIYLQICFLQFIVQYDHLSIIMSNCSVPEEFVLYVDVNRVKMLSLRNSYQVHTLVYGPSDANYVAVAYDALYKMLYISDVTE